jgi:ABC-type transport system substrate-binding protein
MQRSGALTWLIFALLLCTLAVLGVFVFQLDTMEQRFVVQSRQMRDLGESVDRLRGEVRRLAEAGLAAPAAPPAADDAASAAAAPDSFLTPEDVKLTAPDARFDGVLHRPWASGDPKGFNIVTENASELTSLVEFYVASPLARRKAWTNPDEWAGELAERVEISDDFKAFTIHLRRGVRWHRPSVDLDNPRYAWLQGEHELTARDVVFTLDMIMNPQVENGFIKGYYEDLESWQALDDHTVLIRWKRKLYGNIEATLSLTIIPEFLYAYEETGERIPEETLGLKFNQHWYNNRGVVGTGPYRFDAYQPGSLIRLVRNEDFYGDKPALRELIYPIFTDPNKQLLMLKADEIQVGGLRPGQYRDEVLRWQDVPEAERPADNPFTNGTIACEKILNPVYYYIGWNAERPMFADPMVRRAMTHTLDRQRIIDSVFVGLGSVATGPFFKLSPYRDSSIEPWAYDLDEAARLLAAAGWQDSNGDGLLDKDLTPDDGDAARTPFEFSLLVYGTSPEWASLANIFKEDLLKLGIHMTIDSAEWSLMQKRMDERSFDALTGGWSLPWEGDPYQLWHSSQADIPKGSNMVSFRNEEVDRIIMTLRETFDRDERIRLFHRFHRILHELQPYTFVLYPDSVFCWRDSVRNMRFAKMRPIVQSLPWWTARAN